MCLTGEPVAIDQVPISTSDREVLYNTALKVMADGRNSIGYQDWGYKSGSELLKTTASFSAITESLSNPTFRMASFIGKADLSIRKGRIILTDKGYDFNSGPKGRKLQEALMAREAGDNEGYLSLKEEALKGAGFFESLRIWASAINVNYKKVEKYEIDLGPAPSK